MYLFSLFFLFTTALFARDPFVSVNSSEEDSNYDEELVVVQDPSKPREQPIDVQEIEFDNDLDEND